MLVADDERRYVDANAAACAMLDMSRDDILRRRIDDFVPPEARGQLAESWRTFLRDGASREMFAFTLPSGRRVRAEAGAVAHVGPSRHLSILVPLRDPAPGAGPPLARPLSRREREVLGLLALGGDGPQIAAQLVLSPATVRTHVNNAMRKLWARTRAHAIALALRDGLVDL